MLRIEPVSKNTCSRGLQKCRRASRILHILRLLCRSVGRFAGERGAYVYESSYRYGGDCRTPGNGGISGGIVTCQESRVPRLQVDIVEVSRVCPVFDSSIMDADTTQGPASTRCLKPRPSIQSSLSAWTSRLITPQTLHHTAIVIEKLCIVI
jgi:hypothetical protein